MSSNDEDTRKIVVDLEARRAEIVRTKAARPHEGDDAFAFFTYEHDEATSVGVIPGNFPVTILFDPENRTGISMTRADARKLAAELLAAADATPPFGSEDPQP